MITEKIRRLIEEIDMAFVASSDGQGHPHLAAGRELKVLEGDLLVFENWFCPETLRNVAGNPSVSVAVVAQADGSGYQLLGRVVESTDTALLDGYAPGTEPVGMPQVLTRLVVKVERILAFSSGIHSDLPLSGI